MVMLKLVNSADQPMNIFAEFNIGSFGSENEIFTYDQDYAAEKLSGFGIPWKIHEPMMSTYEKENVIQEEMNMKKNVNKVKCDIQSHIVGAGFSQKEAVEVCATEYGWSDSDSNFSNKLEKQTIRYREVLELAEVLGYEIVWHRRRDD